MFQVRVFETKLEEIKNLQHSITEYERKENAQSIAATNKLLDSLTKNKMQLVESQMNIQKEIDSINEYNANQEVISLQLLIINTIIALIIRMCNIYY